MIARLWPLALGAFSLGLDAYVLAGLLPAMARDLASTQALAGLGVALFTAAYSVSAPALAFVAERCSTRRALLAGLALFTLGNAATALAPSLAVLLAARLLAGVGAGLYSPLAASSAAGMVDDAERGRALALVLAGLSVGTALGVPVGLLIEARFGWRWTIVLIVLLGAAAAIGVAGGERRFPVAAPQAWRDRLTALREPFTLVTLGVTLWAGIASLGLYTYMAEVATARDAGTHVHAFIWLWGLGGMAGALLIGRVIDRVLAPRHATLLLLLLLSLGFALVSWGIPWVMGAGCFLWGLAGWASIAPQQHALVGRSGAKATVAIAWNSSVNYLGGAIGAALGSAALSHQWPASWLPVGALAFVALALAFHLGKARLKK